MAQSLLHQKTVPSSYLHSALWHVFSCSAEFSSYSPAEHKAAKRHSAAAMITFTPAVTETQGYSYAVFCLEHLLLAARRNSQGF